MKLSLALKFAILLPCAMASMFSEDPLKVTLFYESYCPDCVQYVEQQLSKAHNVFMDRLLLDLLPFGNAEQRFVDDHWEFECQHGPRECLANKLHACAIDQACGGSGTVSCAEDKLHLVVKYISCVMNQHDQLQATAQCAKSSKLDADSIISCAKGDHGDQLLNFYGNRTIGFTPRIQYVPTVLINGKHNTDAENDLMKEICRLRPTLCEPEVILV